MPVRHRKLEYYLKQQMHPSHKKVVDKKLKELLSYKPEIDSEPLDCYRLYGQSSIRIELIEELNKLIMEATGQSYLCLQYWAQELWDLREHYREMLSTSRAMIYSLIAHGHPDGFYRDDDYTPDGKSKIVKEMAEKLGVPAVNFPLSECSPEDITGLPKTTTAGGGQAGSTI